MDILVSLVFTSCVFAYGFYVGWHHKAGPVDSLLGVWHHPHQWAAWAAFVALLAWVAYVVW